VDDDAPFAGMLERVLRTEGHEAMSAGGVEEALDTLANRAFDVVLTDVKMPGKTGIDLLAEVRRRHPETQVVVMTGYGTIELTVRAMKLGAADFIPKPFDNRELLLHLAQLGRVRRLEREVRALRGELEDRHGFEGIVAVSQGMRRAVDRAAAAARTTSSVLIVGETGTGKELIARAIHYGGPRAQKRFVAINCAALPREIMESELFGHVRGAFTGALGDKRGLFRAAHGGTLFLDEIAEMPVETQAKLLRALEEGSVRPVGHDREVVVDVRIVAATNRDPEAAVRDGVLRADLYYRLGVITVALPPLRERPEDVAPLARRLLEELNQRLGRRVGGFSPETMAALERHDWPGNVRELRNVIEGALAMETGERIGQDALPARLRRQALVASGLELTDDGDVPPLDATLKAVERRLISRALERAGGNKSRAAEMLGISRKRVYRKLEEYGLDDVGGD
jgi:DNA-binding NtrC family response regulator